MKSRLFNADWLFAKHKPENWEKVTLPHDWLIYDTNNLYETGIGYYKKELDASGVKESQRVILSFDGVYMDSVLYVNGARAGEWKYGYTKFEHDITDFIKKDGINELLLTVDYKSPNSRWYSGAGIYRDVHLIIKNAAHFISDGIYITPRKTQNGKWEVKVVSEIETSGKEYEIRHTLNSGVFTSSSPGNDTDTRSIMTLNIENPKIWDIDYPNLYTLKSELIIDGEVTDTEETRFGFREIEFTPDNGFLLNGRRVKLNGACQHHDLGALGAAVNKNAIKRQLLILRRMGVNAIRTSHNPPAAAFLELTDELGFLVMSELTDMWQMPKTEFDYARFFNEWVSLDAASWVRRDRNCPSVIMWSVGNEIYDTQASFEKGSAVMQKLMGFVASHDPDGHARVTLCSNYIPWENTQKCADIIKLIGYNYAENLYREHHAAHPDWIIYGSETASTVQSRSVYHFPLKKPILAEDNLQCSCLGNGTTSWGAKNVEAFLTDDRDAEFSLGQFIWTGTDYIGEPTPYHTKNSYFGHSDTAGFPKDTFYVIQSAWTDYKKSPMIHIFPYWDFSPGQTIDVRVCSNAPRFELYLNDRLIGGFAPDHKAGKKIIGDFSVPYENGELKALAYDENGAVIAETVRKSFGDACKLSSKTEIFGDIAFYEITALDADGNIVENANNRVSVTVRAGELLGLDNGDSTDFEQYKTNNRRLFGGRLLAIARVAGDDFMISADIDPSDIPIRKIELAREGFLIKAKILPENSSYDKIIWRLTDSGGIDSPLGKIEPSQDTLTALVAPKGDGEVYVRAAAENGRGHINLISYLTFDITGAGKTFIDPYSFVSGGLSNLSNVELTIGNERGVGTLPMGESHVGFSGLDFGNYGSDELVLPLFSLSNEPFNFEVWEGMPQDGGTLINEYTYELGSIWNTYQTMTCKLSKRLRGVTTLCLVFRKKVHIKGFSFNVLQKAYQKLYASENDTIYGDSYTVTSNAIEHIGNNVSVIFNGMDFGVKGSARVEICSRSAKEKNSFRFVSKNASGAETVSMIEVPGSSDYETNTFTLAERISGENTVSLIFLPGCDFDLSWFRFIEG